MRNNSINQSIGELKEYQLTSNGLSGRSDLERIRLTIYSPSIIRVRVTRNELFDSFDYSIFGKPEKTDYEVKDDTEKLSFSTNEILLEVSKSPFRISFKTLDGKVINEDDSAFGVSWIGEQVCNYKRLHQDEKFIGLGEKTGPLNRRGSGYENWNTDHYAYGVDSDPIYSSIPFYIGIHSGLVYGIFLNNSHKTNFNFGASNNRFSSYSADQGDMDYFFFHGDSVAQIIRDYSTVTGRMNLPPQWALGYQQCRYSYYPDKEVLSTAQNFRDREIPADAIVLDIHYMDKYKIFTWDKERFPDPKRMIDQLKDLDFRVVVMCDPGIKNEPGYAPYDDGVKEDIFLKYPDGTPYEGEVWPGWCHFPDFTSEKARKWWLGQLKVYSDLGIDGYWNDMNEIATWGHKLPELIEFSFEGERASSRKGRNLYGYMMAKSTYEAGVENLGKRPFNLTRSGFAGIQRYAAVWTGDNIATDEHMLLGIRLVNSLGLSGVPFTGFDAGGFIGNATEDLFARWISLGAFSPFFRGHSMINSRDSEPWTYGETVEEISRNYIKLRYRILPYLYACFYHSSKTGIPVSRSLAIDYTHDEHVYMQGYENEYLFGDSLLVVPVESTKELTKAYFPEGGWYDMFTDEYREGGQQLAIECPLEKLPVFVKASGILVMQSQIYSTAEQPNSVLEVHIYHGQDSNSFEYYEDDGESFEYENGSYFKRVIDYTPSENLLVLGDVEGNYESKFTSANIYFHGCEKVEIEGREVRSETYRFIDPLTSFDPVYDGGTDYRVDNLPCINVPFTSKQEIIKWK